MSSRMMPRVSLPKLLAHMRKEFERSSRREAREKARIKKYNKEMRRKGKGPFYLCNQCKRLFVLKKGMIKGADVERADSRGDGYLIREWTISCPRRGCRAEKTIRTKYLRPVPPPTIIRWDDMDSR